MGVVGGMRRRASSVVGAYGRAVVGVAEVIAGAVDRSAGGPAAPSPVSSPPTSPRPAPPVAAPADVPPGITDLGQLRALALGATLAAAVDPARSAADRFAAHRTGISEWSAGRLLTDSDRMRVAALVAAQSVAGPGGLVHQRPFVVALRQQFPWLDDATAYTLWDHAVLVSGRSGTLAPEDPEPDDAKGGLGGLLGRLRRRG